MYGLDGGSCWGSLLLFRLIDGMDWIVDCWRGKESRSCVGGHALFILRTQTGCHLLAVVVGWLAGWLEENLGMRRGTFPSDSPNAAEKRKD